MSGEMPAACGDLIALQRGVVTRSQALMAGLQTDAVGRLVRSGRWQSLQRGVYAAFTGELPREAALWAIVQRAGRDAMISHQSAAELAGLTDRPSSLIHVTIPANRRIEPIPETVIHRSRRAQQARHPSLLPPQTRIEETVLDLVQQACTFDDAFSWACSACQRRLTTAGRLRSSMEMRKRLRWRAELSDALADIGHGVHSLLEHRYVRRVERPHGLPRAARQAKITRGRRSCYLDNFYADFGLCVELDGQAGHPDHGRWQDIRRDNAAAADGLTTLRYGWADVMHRPCATAQQVAAVLEQRGWRGPPHPCGAGCVVGSR